MNGVYKIWVEAGKLVFKQTLENLTLVESATAVMRAALDKIKFRENGNTSSVELFNDLALSDLEVIFITMIWILSNNINLLYIRPRGTGSFLY